MRVIQGQGGDSEGMEHSGWREDRRTGEGGGWAQYLSLSDQRANEEDVGNIENRKIKLASRVGDASPIPRINESALSELVFINVR